MTSPLGEFIRRQRELQELSMRQLADLAGISNPYLSQIERGLREPSEKVLEAIAENLQLSADVLFERGGRRAAGACGRRGDPLGPEADGPRASSAAGGLQRVRRASSPEARRPAPLTVATRPASRPSFVGRARKRARG